MISILMPIYNGSEYFDKALESIKNQTFKKWELLIGINGHPQESGLYKELKEKTKGSKKIKIFVYHFSGKAKTLNKMLKKAKYSWIALLDVDDLWHPQKLAKQIRYTMSYDIIGTSCRYFGDLKTKAKIATGLLYPSLFLKNNPIINSSCLIKKSLCSWNEKLPVLEDYDLWLSLVKEEYSFFNLTETLTFHRIHKNSFFNTDNRQELIKKELLEKYKKDFIKKGLIIPQKRGILGKILTYFQVH